MKTRNLITLIAMMLMSVGIRAYDARWDSKLSGTVLCSSNASMAPKAFDGSVSSYYRASRENMEYVGLDLGTPHVITRIEYASANSSSGADRMLLSVLEGANSPDFMDAIPLYLISEKPKPGTLTAVDVNVSRGFRYVRYVGASGSSCNIAELAFYGHEGEGDDSQFYQVTNLPTMSIHVADNNVPINRGEDFESHSTLIYEGGKLVQEYPVLVRVRGNYSTTPENKPYRVKFNDGKSHHMMKGSSTNESPVKAKKWVLLNSWRDKTLMRNNVSWYNSAQMKPKFTPWNQPVDLIVNGDYRGTYTLADHISVHEGRIDVTEMTPEDTEGEALTGGYFIEADNNYSREPYHFLSGHGNTISVHDPAEDIMQPEQFDYIRDRFNDMENLLFGSNYTDPVKGYRSAFDLESFLNYFLISEFNGNTDMICQVFMYKERGDDHFYTGPVWDHDLALDDDSSVFPTNNRADWIYSQRCTGQFGTFVSRILSDPMAMAALQEKWARLRDSGAVTAEKLTAGVDSLREEMRASARLNFIRWPYFDQYISLTVAIRESWDEEVDVVRDYVEGRIAWMDRKLSYNTLSMSGDYYEIKTARDLCLFSQMVNSGERDANARLLADIDMTAYNDRFLPIGNGENPYYGTFDGQGHSISNLHVSQPDYAALFGSVTDGMSVCNLVIDGSCSFQGDRYVAAFIARAGQGAVSIDRCGTAASVTATETNAAAFVAGSTRQTSLTLSCCYNVGSVTSPLLAAAMAVPGQGSVTVGSSYSTGKVTGAAQDKDFAFGSRSCVIDNCYALSSTQASIVTEWQVHSGELCYLLNGGDGASGTTLWRQNIDNGRPRNEYPVLSATSGKVLKDGETYTNINKNFTGYRYYQLHITELGGGTGGVLQLSEFDILDEVGQDVASLSVLAGPDGFGGEGWENIADNYIGSKFCGAFTNDLRFFFDAGDVVKLSGYRMYTAGDTQSYPDRNPVSWTLYGCNSYTLDGDDPEWEIVDEKLYDETLGATNNTPYDFLLDTGAGGEPAEDGPVYISNALQLIDFAAMVNNGQADLDAFLTADIDMSGYSSVYKPIGSQEHPYHGTFDGQGHSVRLDIVATTDYQGMFGFIEGGAHIRNLVTKGSVVSTAGRMAGMVAQAQGASGTVRFTNCGNEATVTGNNNRAAGILGNNWGGVMTVVMENVYNTGNVSCNTNAAGLCGHLGGTGSSLINCYNAGEISAPTRSAIAINPSGVLGNCYATENYDGTAEVNVVSEEAVRSGELCFLLNGGRTSDVVWYQNIGEDSHPVFNEESGIVYATDGGAPFHNSVGTVQVDLAQGWNWASHNLASPVSIDRISPYSSIIRSQTEESFLDEEYGWVGSLTELQPVTAYKVKSPSGGSLSLRGDMYDLSQPVGIHRGWNWIGVPMLTGLDGSELELVGFSPSDNDRIVGQEGFIGYWNGAWTGSLGTLQPGRGYMIYSQQEQTLRWSALARRVAMAKTTCGDGKDDASRLAVRRVATQDLSSALSASRAYPNVMNAIVTLDGAQDGMEVRAFAGDECRAMGVIRQGVCFLTIYGEGGEQLSFRLSEGAFEREADQTAAFTSLAMLGSGVSPYVLTFDGVTDISSLPGAEEAGSDAYYSVDGRRVSRPQKGVYIRLSDRKDGTSQVRKEARNK